MKRLTKWIDDGENRQAIPDPEMRSNGHGKCCNKLAEYEDLEEQGRLLRLPCDIGTRVYKPFIVVCREKPWIFSPNIDVHYITLEDLPEMGKKVFLTSQEADIKLNSMIEEYKASLKMEEKS